MCVCVLPSPGLWWGPPPLPAASAWPSPSWQLWPGPPLLPPRPPADALQVCAWRGVGGRRERDGKKYFDNLHVSFMNNTYVEHFSFCSICLALYHLLGLLQLLGALDGVRLVLAPPGGDVSVELGHEALQLPAAFWFLLQLLFEQGEVMAGIGQGHHCCVTTLQRRGRIILCASFCAAKRKLQRLKEDNYSAKYQKKSWNRKLCRCAQRQGNLCQSCGLSGQLSLDLYLVLLVQLPLELIDLQGEGGLQPDRLGQLTLRVLQLPA